MIFVIFAELWILRIQQTEHDFQKSFIFHWFCQCLCFSPFPRIQNTAICCNLIKYMAIFSDCNNYLATYAYLALLDYNLSVQTTVSVYGYQIAIFDHNKAPYRLESSLSDTGRRTSELCKSFSVVGLRKRL